MIAEHLVRKRDSGDKNGLRALAAYVIHSKAKGPATDWKIGDYVIDAEHGGAKVGRVRVHNCEEVDPGKAITEMLALSQMNTRSKADRAFHLVISFPEGEHPTDEQLDDIEAELVASIGFGDHKRISASHTNTDNLHVHVAICTVHPVTFKLPTPYRSHYKLQEACIALEERHGLIRDNHNRGGKGQITEREKAGFGLWIETNAGEQIRAAAAAAHTWDDLHRELAKHGLVIKPRGAGLIIAHYKDGRSMVKASTVDRGLSKFSLEKRLGPYEGPGALGITPSQQFTPGARQPEAEMLWAKYQAERQASLAARQNALAALKTRHVAYAEALAAWYEKRHEAARAQRLARADRMATRRALIDERKQDRAERLAWEKSERDTARAAHLVPNWQSFLEREAAAGDPVAAQSLRRSTGQGLDTSVATENARAHISVLVEIQRVIRENLQPVRSRDSGLGR